MELCEAQSRDNVLRLLCPGSGALLGCPAEVNSAPNSVGL